MACSWYIKYLYKFNKTLSVISNVLQYTDYTVKLYKNTSLFDPAEALKGQKQYNRWFDDIYSNNKNYL